MAEPEAKNNTQPYEHLADLEAHRRERNELIAQHLGAMDGPPAVMEEIRAHQMLITQREDELADMPVPPGIILSSSDTQTWMFAGGKWVQQPTRIRFERTVSLSRSIFVNGKTWTVCGKGDNQLNTDGKQTHMIAGVIIGIDSTGGIYRGRIDGQRIVWSNATPGLFMYPAFCNDSCCVYVCGGNGIIAYDVAADSMVVIPHHMKTTPSISADGDVLVLWGSADDIHCMWKDGHGKYTIMPRAPFNRDGVIETLYLRTSW